MTLVNIRTEDDVIDLIQIAYSAEFISECRPFTPTDQFSRKVAELSLSDYFKKEYTPHKIGCFYDAGETLTPNQLAMLILQDMVHDPQVEQSLENISAQIRETARQLGSTVRALELGFTAFILDHLCKEKVLEYQQDKNVYRIKRTAASESQEETYLRKSVPFTSIFGSACV